MKTVGVTGVRGLVGSAVAREMAEAGWRVVGFSRRAESKATGPLAELRPISAGHAPDLTELDAVVHLAGESILGRWTADKKRRIRESRMQGTRSIVEGLAGHKAPIPLVCASAVGFYGDTADRIVDESSPCGEGFLSEVTQAWENEAVRAELSGSRVVRLRFGMILGQEGGAFPLLQRVFGLGLAGPLGDGKQWMSCLHVRDAARLVRFALEQEAVSGPLNAVQPEPIPNREFTRSLARALHRPAVLPAPAFALKMVLGEFSHLLLDSARVVPTATAAEGFTWQYPDLASMWADLLAT
jgi:uncharacterized protein (TIGR01777 family)